MLWYGGNEWMAEKQEHVQEIVHTQYMNEQGLIHAYPQQPNSQYLSESIGLYMEFLLRVKDQQGFEQQFVHLVDHFLVQQGNERYIRWELEEHTTVNALIDDVRIIKVLQQASDEFHNPEYAKVADRLQGTIQKQQKQTFAGPESAGLYTDFYDWTLEIPASRVTLSYLTPEFWELFPDAQKNKDLLLQDEGIFLPEYYDGKTRQWIHAKEAHMVDQLLIALNKEPFGQDSDFYAWVVKEWEDKQVIKGRYDKNTLQPTVSYESLAVYHYLYKYFLKKEEPELAMEVYKRAKQIADQQVGDKVHFFDFIHYQLLQLNESEREV